MSPAAPRHNPRPQHNTTQQSHNTKTQQDQGNDAFRAGRYSEAEKFYTDALNQARTHYFRSLFHGYPRTQTPHGYLIARAASWAIEPCKSGAKPRSLRGVVSEVKCGVLLPIFSPRAGPEPAVAVRGPAGVQPRGGAEQAEAPRRRGGGAHPRPPTRAHPLSESDNRLLRGAMLCRGDWLIY